jgi:PAS domain S-box-containing protein
MIFTTLFSFACAPSFEAITSWRPVRISRAEVADWLGMSGVRYQIRGRRSNAFAPTAEPIAASAVEPLFRERGLFPRRFGKPELQPSLMLNSPPNQDKSLKGVSGDRRFQLLVEAIKDYAIYLLDTDGFINSWNTGAQHFKGYSAEEILGEHFSRFYTDEDRAVGLPARALRIAAEEGKFEAEGWRVRKDGSRFWASVVIDPIHDATQALIGFAKITRDMTERRRAQDELDRAREQLAQAQKMEAVGRLTGGVAHDFNNLLTVIRSSVDLLRRPGIADDKRDRYLEAISETADRAAKLTGQLLAFARRQPLQAELFAVADRIARTRQILATTLGSPIRLDYRVAEDCGSIEADPGQFETALLNMAINARDAMPQGGTLTIAAGPAETAPVGREGRFVAISIADSGHGIDPEALHRVFEPFFTTKEPGKGTGLGLSQVYAFAKQSGGEIEVDSRPGEGTIFTLYLPQADADAEPAMAGEEMLDAAAPIEARRVLIVEDNETVGEFAMNLLIELGQQVSWAADAAIALAMIEETPEAFDLVFSDVVMPGINGVELAEEIRRRWPNLPVVLTSGYSHVLVEEGSHGFELLKKPYSIDALTGILRARPRLSPR